MELLLLLLAATIAWCYAGYPLWIILQAKLRPQPLRPAPSGSTPSVTVVVAVRNERRALRRRIENLLTQHYPTERLAVVIVCNGSEDGTEALAREMAHDDPRVRMLIGPAAGGKAAALNLAVEEATSEIIVFADARQTFAPDAVARLIEPFADPAVGAVTGRLLVHRADRASVEGVRLYWGLETRLRDAESRSGSVVGATGAIYSVRRALFEPIPPNLILDDVLVPMRIAMRGFRVVMAADAVAYDVPASDQKAEYLRKRRTMVGNIQLVRSTPALLSPIRNPLFFRFVSHKIVRLLTPFCFVGVLVATALMPGALYRAIFVAELAVYIIGAAGLVVRIPGSSVPSAFVLVHAAVFAAVWRWRDDASRVWQPSRDQPGVTTSAAAPATIGRGQPEAHAPSVHLTTNA